MKQHISVEQVSKLSEKGKERLRKWWKPKSGDWISTRFSSTYLTYGRKEDNSDEPRGAELITEQETDSGYYGWCLDDTFPSKPVPKKYDYEYKKGKRNRALEILSDALPLFSIGQMIEFLENKWKFLYLKRVMVDTGEMYWNIVRSSKSRRYNGYKELCNALWKAVKEILEE